MLQNVYHQDNIPANRAQIESEALVQAYAKPLLLSLLLYVVASKLKLLVVHGLPDLNETDRNKLYAGLDHARNLVAENVAPTADIVTELFKHVGRATTMLRNGGLPTAETGIYTPISQDPLDRMAADLSLAGSGACEFAVAFGLIGLGLERGIWTARKDDLADPSGGAMILQGRSGSAKVYFASNSRAAIRLGTNGLIAENQDVVIIHSHENPPSLPRYPRRPPGRTGLRAIREVSIETLTAGGTEIEGLIERFRSEMAL